MDQGCKSKFRFYNSERHNELLRQEERHHFGVLQPPFMLLEARLSSSSSLRLLNQCNHLLSLLASIFVNDDEDNAVWKASSNKRFSTASHYQFIISRGVRCSFASSLWSTSLSHKFKYFLWLAWKKRLNTREFIERKIGKNLGSCVLC